MRRFVFTLQRLLNLKEYREKECETELGEVTSRCVRFRRDIKDCESLHRKTLAVRSGHTAIEELVSSELFMRRMREDVVRLNTELEEAEKERDEVQKRYLEASRERKVLDKLKEKQSDSYYKEQAKEEMKNMDEINTSSAVRKIAGGNPF